MNNVILLKNLYQNNENSGEEQNLSFKQHHSADQENNASFSAAGISAEPQNEILDEENKFSPGFSPDLASTNVNSFHYYILGQR